MFGADARVCRLTLVRLWGRLEAYFVGGTTATHRCEEGVVWVGAEGGARCGVGGFVMWL